MKIVIIEDEPLLAEELEHYISIVHKDYEISAVLPSVKEAVSFFQSNDNYQIVFSDIQLGDGLSFDIFRQININAPIIFCTAYNQYAIEAFKNNGIDYLLKPFGQESVKTALMRYEKLKTSLQLSSDDYQKMTRELEESHIVTTTNNAILVTQRDKIIPIKKEEIALFSIRNGIVRLVDFNKNDFVINYTLDELEMISGKAFYRIDRQHLVNRSAIRDVSQFLSRKLKLNLTIDYPEIITVRKEKIADFLEWLSMSY
jgi:two-component system, LytTR family, response regulator LytT